MVVRLPFASGMLFVLLTVAPACSKTPANGGSATEEKSAAKRGGDCEPAATADLLAEIAREEAAKSELEKTAKSAPEKANFQRLYDAEVAFVAATDAKLARLTGCSAPETTVKGVLNKLQKARTNVTYLRESFPDFK